jgi:iron complex transport system substrate-binding protein
MRIVSLEPGCTEWLAAFDALEFLAARSHACDYPPSATDRPIASSSLINATTSRAIHNEIMTRLERGLGEFEVDTDLIASLEPDLILTNGDPHIHPDLPSDFAKEIASRCGKCPQIFSMRPATFKQVLNEALRLGSVIGRARQAMTCVATLERRLAGLQSQLGIRKKSSSSDLPSVVCFGWLDPIITSGYWISDMIALAGGREVVHAAGGPCAEIEWEAVLRADPDVLAIIPHGFDLEKTRGELGSLMQRPGWRDLKAVRTGYVFAFDGRGCFSRPGPRLYRGIELLACALHPEKSECEAEEWEMEKVRSALKPGA